MPPSRVVPDGSMGFKGAGDADVYVRPKDKEETTVLRVSRGW